MTFASISVAPNSDGWLVGCKLPPPTPKETVLYSPRAGIKLSILLNKQMSAHLFSLIQDYNFQFRYSSEEYTCHSGLMSAIALSTNFVEDVYWLILFPYQRTMSSLPFYLLPELNKIFGS